MYLPRPSQKQAHCYHQKTCLTELDDGAADPIALLWSVQALWKTEWVLEPSSEKDFRDYCFSEGQGGHLRDW